MFEKLFTKPFTIERYRSAPLAEHRRRYLRHLATQGAARLTLRQIANDQVRLLCILDLKEGERISVSRIEATAADWPHARVYRVGRRLRSSRRSVKYALGRIVRWLRFLGWLDEPIARPRHLHGAEVATYERWMRDERGYVEVSIQDRLRTADEFFDWLKAKGKPLGSVTIANIDASIAAKAACRDYSRVTIRTHAARLRTFFRFAEERGWCKPGTAAGIIPERLYPGQNVRSTLSQSDIRNLLATTEGDRPVDKRDRAILMLFIVYGLRAGEVRCLQLEDLDWHNETLRVHRPKTGRTDLYPLSRAVGQAIVRYLLEVRPPWPERALFLTISAPIRPLGRTAPGTIVRRRMDNAGIAAARRGPHALRHTAAQHLLDRGASMKVIGDYLGHRNARSTKTYARFDLNALREVADFNLEGLS